MTRATSLVRQFGAGLWVVVCGLLLGDGPASDPWASPTEIGIPTSSISSRDPSVSSTDVRVIEGRLLLERGDSSELDPPPPASCRIRVWQAGTPMSERVPCGPDGEFEVPLRRGAEGDVAVELEVPGRLRALLETVVPRQTRGRLPAVALGFAVRVTGDLLDAAGHPIPAIEVQAMPIPNLGESEPWRARTDQEGRFVFDTLPPGRVALRVALLGFAPTVRETVAPQEGVVIVLERLLELTGRVVGPPAALAAARVRIEGSGIWPAREIPVEADGSFVVESIPDGVYALEAIADPEGETLYASLPLENVVVSEFAARPTGAESPSPELELKPAVELTVRIVDSDERPIQGARVLAARTGLGVLRHVEPTDAGGRVNLAPLAPGDYVVHVDADGWLPSEPLAVELDDDRTFTVHMRRPHRIEGIVVDDRGTAVAGATIDVRRDDEEGGGAGEDEARALLFASAWQATGSLGVTRGPVPNIPAFARDVDVSAAIVSDAEGGFVIGGLATGTYRLEATHPEFSDSEGTLVVTGRTAKDVRLVLQRGWRLSGRVIDSNGRPIDEVEIEGTGARVYTDEHGTFDLGIVRGRVELVARAKGFAPTRVIERVTVEPVELEVTLAEAIGALEGRVVDGNGRPRSGARVTVQFQDGLSATEVAWTDERGLWSLTGLPGGRVDIEAFAEGLAPSETQARIDPPGATTVDLTLEDGWGAEIRVTSLGNDDPIEGAEVFALGRHVRTDRRGLADLGPLQGDAALVRVEAEGFVSVEQTVVRPTDSGRVDVDVELVEGGGIEGWVTDYRGDPVPNSEVQILDAATGDSLGTTRTAADGSWSFDGIREGAILLHAEPPADRNEELAETAQDADVLRARVTPGIDLRFDRR